MYYHISPPSPVLVGFFNSQTREMLSPSLPSIPFHSLAFSFLPLKTRKQSLSVQVT